MPKEIDGPRFLGVPKHFYEQAWSNQINDGPCGFDAVTRFPGTFTGVIREARELYNEYLAQEDEQESKTNLRVFFPNGDSTTFLGIENFREERMAIGGGPYCIKFHCRGTEHALVGMNLQSWELWESEL